MQLSNLLTQGKSFTSGILFLFISAKCRENFQLPGNFGVAEKAAEVNQNLYNSENNCKKVEVLSNFRFDTFYTCNDSAQPRLDAAMILVICHRGMKSFCRRLSSVQLIITLDTELSDDKGIQRRLRYQCCAATKLRASIFRCSKAVKNVCTFSFLLYAHVCITIMVLFQEVMHAEDACGL